jgi:endonuclease/exonuclease/phosphatase family metal-dependent hydrolase
VAGELRVLSWNLYHGRAVPPAGRSLLDEFAGLIAGWEWDVALLQEVPPWWPPALARAAGARQRTALTSRNALLPLRRLVAEHRPDLIKSNGGGANAILARAEIAEHETWRLRWLPERRIAHAVRLGDGTCVANLHAQVHSVERARADIARALEQVLGFAGSAPVVFGGDFNIPDPELPGFVRAGADGVDQVWARGLVPAGPAEVPPRGPLSDHPPLIVTLRHDASNPSRGRA